MRARMRRAEEPTVNVKFCLVFQREALSVPVMRRVLGDTLRRLGAADEDGIADLLLAVTEACTNVIRHGRGGPGSRYEVVASIGEGGCLVQVLNGRRRFESPVMPPARGGRPAGPRAISARVTAGRCARGCSGRRAAAWPPAIRNWRSRSPAAGLRSCGPAWTT